MDGELGIIVVVGELGGICSHVLQLISDLTILYARQEDKMKNFLALVLEPISICNKNFKIGQ